MPRVQDTLEETEESDYKTHQESSEPQDCHEVSFTMLHVRTPIIDIYASDGQERIPSSISSILQRLETPAKTFII